MADSAGFRVGLRSCLMFIVRRIIYGLLMLQCSMNPVIRSLSRRKIGQGVRRGAFEEGIEMTNGMQPEVPAEMREFAERSVAQARKAFEGFMGAVQKTTGAVQSATSLGQNGAHDVSEKAVSFAESNVNAAFDLAEKIVKAKDVQEVLSLQAEYLKHQMDAIQQQTRELGDAVQKAAGVKK
jgi:phasin